MTPIFALVFIAAVIISITLFTVLIQQTKEKPDKKTPRKRRKPPSYTGFQERDITKVTGEDTRPKSERLRRLSQAEERYPF